MSSAEQPKLEISGPTGERILSLEEHPVVEIGRGQSNLLCLVSQAVSRRHALIRRQLDGSFTLIDLGSRNGTEVNGRRLEAPADLEDGDCIQIGEYRILFRGPAGSGAKKPAKNRDESTRLLVREKPVSVLVLDMHDYTGLSQALESTELSRLLGAFGARSAAILGQHGAWNHKTIADAVMAVWVHESLSTVAGQIRGPLCAACELSAMVGGLGREFRTGRELRCGVAISCGEAAVGGLGSAGRADVVGDTVNLAFRLEAATRRLGEDLLVCEATRYVTSGAPAAMFREYRTELKGYDAPVRAFGVSMEALRHWLGVG